MYCANCGSEINDGSKFCKNCGAQVNAASAVPAQQIPASDTESGETATVAATPKKKGSVGSLITLIICIILNVINYVISIPIMCFAGLMSIIAPFGMMIGAYYEEAYLAAFLSLGISAIAAAASTLGIASSCANRALSKKGDNTKGRGYLKVVPFIITGGAYILSIISLVVISGLAM